MIKHIASVHARNPPHPTGTFLSHHPAHYAARGMHPGVFREFHQSQGKRASIANRIRDQFLVLCCDPLVQCVGAFNRVYLKRVSHEGLPQLILKWPVRDPRHHARTTPGLINLMHTQLATLQNHSPACLPANEHILPQVFSSPNDSLCHKPANGYRKRSSYRRQHIQPTSPAPWRYDERVRDVS